MSEASERRADHKKFIEDVSDAILRKLNTLQAIPESVHVEHHEFITDHKEFIKEWVDEIKRKRDRREKWKTQVGGWAIVTILGSIGTATYHLFQNLKDHWR